MKKALMLILAITMVVALLAGCTGGATTGTTGSTTTKGATTSGTTTGSTTAKQAFTYPIPGNITLSYSAPEPPHVVAVSAWADTPFIKAWQEQTGITLELSHPADFSLLVASGDYPDIICNNWASYSGGVAGAIKDGIIEPIEDFEDLAPDYFTALASNDYWAKGAKTPDGNIPGFYNLRAEPALNSFGLIMREDWLQDLGLEVPETIDDFYDALVAFREEKGATAPLSMTLAGLRQLGSNGLVTSAFGLVSSGYYHVNGTVHNGAYEPAYKDFLIWLNLFFKEGLLDSNVLTVDGTTANSNIMNGISGVNAGFASGGMGVWLTTMKSVNPDFALTGVGSLVANKGDRAMFGQRQDSLSTLAAITTSCDNVEAAVMFLNYGYSEQGNLLMYYGIEGKSFEMKDGYPYFSDFVKNNPDGLPFAQALSQYDYSPANGPYISNGDYSLQTYNEAQLNALALWRDNDVADHYIPSMLIDAEDMDEYAAIASEVNTYISEQFALFVIGERSLSEFDLYLSTLKSMKIERMIEIYQNSFDEYNAR